MKGFIEVQIDMTVVTSDEFSLSVDNISGYESYTIHLKHNIFLHQKISDKIVPYQYLLVKETYEEIKQKIKQAQGEK